MGDCFHSPSLSGLSSTVARCRVAVMYGMVIGTVSLERKTVRVSTVFNAS